MWLWSACAWCACTAYGSLCCVALGTGLAIVVGLAQGAQVGVAVVVGVAYVVDLVGVRPALPAYGHVPLAAVPVPAEDALADGRPVAGQGGAPVAAGPAAGHHTFRLSPVQKPFMS